MANIVITTSGNSIIVDFGVYTSATSKTPMTKSSFYKSNLCEIHLFSDHVRVDMSAINQIWNVTYDSGYAGTDYYIVDSVAGVAPTSESDLFDKITALR